ncbi:MAG: hypothetical protein CVT92_00440 [Bacteroidetes bacterium HGW-Bacteroidetes-1]|jgi:hypothetical protein|nr:MAG: hypothetical protein CVT92_00440 [Bacteroidetes bacterium HGW-Bacteroidetes-1]
MKNKNTSFWIIPIFLLLIIISCRKDDIISTDITLKLTFSSDSVVFDTVFSSLGTITRNVMVYNTSNKRINISSIRLEKGTQSVYKINADGISGNIINDVEIAANDSIYILVRATIDPQNANSPYVVEDDLVFLTNNNEQRVKLVAWGQDAIYILADQQVGGFPKFKIVADSNETVYWTAEKPYVIYGYALINSYGTLVIEEGANIHFHDKSGLWAYVDGVLKVRGSKEKPVKFQGDRLDQDYRNIPGQWDRIWLMEGRQGFNHEIDYAIIRNGYIGIQAESFLRPTSNQLNITNTIIENHTGIGIFTRLFAIDANNLVVANNGNYGIALTAGGAYRFQHTTIANNWSLSVRNTPALFYNNFLMDKLGHPIPVPINVSFGNSIIYGSNSEEIESELIAGADTLYLFDHCLIKTERDLNNFGNFDNCIKNEIPQFKDYSNFNFRPDSLSPVIGKGKLSIAIEVPIDLDGIDRTASPDLGAYQYVKDPDEE